MRTESGNGHRDCELEIVASRRETLCRSEAVAEAASICRIESHEEDGDEVYGEGHRDPDNGHDLVDDLVSLVREEDEDRVQQAYERPRGGEPEENAFEPARPRHSPQ